LKAIVLYAGPFQNCQQTTEENTSFQSLLHYFSHCHELKSEKNGVTLK